MLDKDKEGMVLDIDIDMDDSAEGLVTQLLSNLTTEIEQNPQIPDLLYQQFSEAVLAKLVSKSSDGLIKVVSVNENNNRMTSTTYLPLGQRKRECSPLSKEESKKRYAREKAKVVENLMQRWYCKSKEHM